MFSSLELLHASALQQASWIREGLVSCEELTDLYLERIARLNPRLNAFVEVTATDARREARRKDALRRRGETLPLFHGVATGIKDLNLLRGTFTRFGSRAFERLYVPFDDRTTALLRRAGFVFLGKTSTSEFGALPVTEPALHPPARNPWDPQRTPGGSSGGAGAAVAAGLLPLAQGGDGAGSIRIPSAFCHLFGLKPSRGRVVNPFGYDDQNILYTMGPLTRTVEDAAALLDVFAGVTVGKPHWAPPPTQSFLAQARRAPPAGLRVAFSTRTPLVPTHPDVEQAVLDVARVLTDQGHHVEEAEVVHATLEEFLPLWQYTIGQMPVTDWSLTQPVSRWLGEHGKSLSEDDYANLMARLSRRVLHWFEGFDVWVTPTVAVLPPAVGAWHELDAAETFAQAATLGYFTALFNVSGQPAASLPVGLTREGMPIGVQLAAKPMAEGLLLAVCRELERALPWQQRHPPMWYDR